MYAFDYKFFLFFSKTAAGDYVIGFRWLPYIQNLRHDNSGLGLLKTPKSLIIIYMHLFFLVPLKGFSQ